MMDLFEPINHALNAMSYIALFVAVSTSADNSMTCIHAHVYQTLYIDEHAKVNS